MRKNENVAPSRHGPAAIPVAEELGSLGDNRQTSRSLVAVSDNFLSSLIKSGQIGSTGWKPSENALFQKASPHLWTFFPRLTQLNVKWKWWLLIVGGGPYCHKNITRMFLFSDRHMHILPPPKTCIWASHYVPKFNIWSSGLKLVGGRGELVLFFFLYSPAHSRFRRTIWTTCTFGTAESATYASVSTSGNCSPIMAMGGDIIPSFRCAPVMALEMCII